MTGIIQKERLLQSFLSYVQIDSEARHERKMCERLVKELTDLGLAVTTDRAGESFGSDGYNVLARLPGTLPGAPILLVAHMDTVAPGCGIVPRVDGDVISSGEGTILGGDDKSGVTAIMEAVRSVLENKTPHRAAELLFSIGEEGSMLGISAFDLAQLASKQAYVIDSHGDVGTIITAAPGQLRMYADIVGRSAHAGLAPEAGISAIQVAAKAIASMHLLRIDEETTCNIGTFRSEYATNIVPERAHLVMEVRSHKLEKLNAQADHLFRCMQDACNAYGATLFCRRETNYVSYAIPPESAVRNAACRAAERIGCKPMPIRGGGGSDANVLNANGIESVVLGTGMTMVHTTEETLRVSQLEKAAEWVLALLTDADETGWNGGNLPCNSME